MGVDIRVRGSKAAQSTTAATAVTLPGVRYKTIESESAPPAARSMFGVSGEDSVRTTATFNATHSAINQ
jgi:hypothetical protein